MKFFKYLGYLLRHKYYVGVECWHEGLYWQAITHDMSKFLPSEFIPYMNHFYGEKKLGIKKNKDEAGYCKPIDTGDLSFDFAWLLHQKRNKHHWQWLIIPEDNGGIKIIDMQPKYINEMICDWIGAGKEQGFTSTKNDKYLETRKWYRKNGSKMKLTKFVKSVVEHKIGVLK